jgi:hypothetical protein
MIEQHGKHDGVSCTKTRDNAVGSELMIEKHAGTMVSAVSRLATMQCRELRVCTRKGRSTIRMSNPARGWFTRNPKNPKLLPCACNRLLGLVGLDYM